MDILSPLILLHENGYKAFTEIAGGEDLGFAKAEVQGKILCLAEGGIDEAGSAAHVRLEPAVQTTLRNQNQGEHQIAQKAINVYGTSKETFREGCGKNSGRSSKTVRV